MRNREREVFHLCLKKEKEEEKRIPRLKFPATFTPTQAHAQMHGPSSVPPWRHVQGSRDHPECFALHCWALPFSALEGGERLISAKRWVRPFHCQHPSFTQASVSQGNSFLSPACVCISVNMCVRVYISVCVRRSASERGTWKGKAGSVTRCQTFSNFLSTANLIGSSDAPTVKGEQDWTMPAGIEQAVGRTWRGMFGMKQGIWANIPPIGLFRGITMCKSMSIVCVFSSITFTWVLLCNWRAEEARNWVFLRGADKRQRMLSLLTRCRITKESCWKKGGEGSNDRERGRDKH